MANRTDADKISRKPIRVTLGGKIYLIVPLVISKSRAWREQLGTFFAEYSALSKADLGDIEAFQAGIKRMFTEMPDRILDLLLDYAPNLDREEIENSATDDEAMAAFIEVFRVAYPFAALGQLAQIVANQ